MKCYLYVTDEYGQIEASLESITLSFLQNLVDIAKQKKFYFLEGIDIKGETIFNPIQTIQLKQNLLALKQQPVIEENIEQYQSFLESINKIINEGNFTYLKISCLCKN